MNLDSFSIPPQAMWTVLQLRGDTGYDAMDIAMRHGWHPLPCWGPEGRDLGDWPLVVVFTRTQGQRNELAEYVEGDIQQWTFDTPEQRREAIDALALTWTPERNPS